MRCIFLLALCTLTIAAAAQDSTQTQLIGKYKFAGGSVVPEVEVTFENGSLMMNSSAGASQLTLIKGDSFNVVNFNGTAVFKRNEVKKVVGVHIDASGYVLDGVKDGATIDFAAKKAYGTPQRIVDVLTSSDDKATITEYSASVKERLTVTHNHSFL